MTREEKKQLIEEYTKFNGVNCTDIDEHIDQFLDSLEMNKEKAIELIENFTPHEDVGNIFSYEEIQALKFAIDFMKNDEEPEIIGWANYYPEENHLGGAYKTKESGKLNVNVGKNSIQCPIIKPKNQNNENNP